MDFRSITLKDTVVYSVTCVREFDQKCVMKDDVRAWNAIGIYDFAKYWIGSFGDQALEKSKSEKGNDCSIIITCSNGDSKVFSTLGKNKFNPDEKKAKSIVTVEVDCEEKKTESAYKDTPIPEKVEVAAEETFTRKIRFPLDGVAPGEYIIKMSLVSGTPRGRTNYYDTIVDFKGYKWLIQTTDYHEVGEVIGIILNPDDIHIMKKSEYSGLFGDYSSYSAEYDEINDPDFAEEDEEDADDED